MENLIIRAVGQDIRYRAGRAWTAGGVVVGRDELDEAGWEAVRADPLLRIEVAPEAAEAEAGADAKAEIAAAIGRLAPEDFGADGKPKLEALRAALPGVKVSAALRDEVWASAKAPAD